MKEATNINKSLSTLGYFDFGPLIFMLKYRSYALPMDFKLTMDISVCRLVIMNLVSMSNGRSLHVPYRDSKLTFLLQVDDSALRCLRSTFSALKLFIV